MSLCVCVPCVYPSLKMDSLCACSLGPWLMLVWWTLECRCLTGWPVLHLQGPGAEKHGYCGSSRSLKEAPCSAVSSLSPVDISRSKCVRAPLSPVPPLHLLSVVFLWMTIVSGGGWYLIMILTCNFLLINNLELVSFSFQTSKQTKTPLCLKVTSWYCLLEGSLCFDVLSNYPPQSTVSGEVSL